MPRREQIRAGITFLEPKTQEELVCILNRHAIPLDEWGKDDAKTAQDLFRELRVGESELLEVNGRLLRKTEGLAIDVYCRVEGKVFHLREEKQVFKDGRERVRGPDVMDTSIGEKLTKREDRDAALARAMHEELGISDTSKLSYVARQDFVRERDSNSYPGLKSQHALHRYDVLLPKMDFKPAGYVEIQDTKSTYFVWEVVPQLPALLASFLASSSGQGSQRL